MTVLRVILGDQLTRGISALDGLDPARDAVLMMEVLEALESGLCVWLEDAMGLGEDVSGAFIPC